MSIRLAKRKDLYAINVIANQAIKTGVSNAYTTPLDMTTRRKWFKHYDRKRFPVYVYENEGKVLGWVAFSPYRGGRNALEITAEISYYVHENNKGCGIGSKMVEFAIKEAPKLKFRNLFAIIMEKNFPSIELMKKFGFEQWAFLPNVADFDGVEMSQVYYGKRI